VILALLHALRDMAIGLCFAGLVALLLHWGAKSERKHAAQVEQEDLADFAEHMRQQSHPRDWEFPAKWHPPAKEYVAKPRGRVR